MFIGATLMVASALPSACGSGSGSRAPLDASSVDSTVPEDAAPDGEAGLPPLEREPPALIPPAQRLNANSSPVVYDGLRGRVWTANGDVGSISYVDIDAPKVLAEIPIGKDITSVALSPDFTWIGAVDRDGATVTLVDATSQAIARVIPVGTHPRATVWDAWNPRYLYVTLEDDGGVGVIDRTLGIYQQTIPIGRLPSGLTVSKGVCVPTSAVDAGCEPSRHDMYVNQRVDPKVTRVSLDTFKVQDAVTLAVQPSDPAPTTPQGKPFAFESSGLSTDIAGYTYLWVPHQLLAPTHPFQFQQTVFPAVSVIDYTNGVGVEAVTDPNDPNGVIAGRKLLFDAINIPDAAGSTSIMSQPCAVAMHPNTVTSYVLACGSEDLLTFDLTAGIAVDLLRNLPGDHPVGMALDTMGQRLFVVSDQSHTLVRLDTANGNLTQHVSVIGGPVALVARDPVDPAKRAGLTLFFRANSSKGALATTGNNWQSCGACHLDGFVTTNAFLFEASHVVDESVDAQIGHVGLADLFSTSPTPTSKTFNPHDILVAFTDMGGLAPDRTGATRSGAINPSSPTAAATMMASQVAEVVARDLPLGPSWLLAEGPDGGAPNEAYDGKWCGGCHAEEYMAWQNSAHAHSAVDSMVTFCTRTEDKLLGGQISRHCAGCHDPVSARLGDTSLASGRGITCLGCHDVSRLIQAGGNADLVATSQDWNTAHAQQGAAELTRLRSPQFCAGCHEQFVPGTGLGAITTYDEWSSSAYAQGAQPTRCVDCHMPVTFGKADHQVVGGNVFMATQYATPAMVALVQAKLANSLELTPTRTSSGSVQVQIKNKAIGHSFPTGVTDLREAWVELDALDANGKVLAAYGGPDPTTGILPGAAARLGIDIATASGQLLLDHELSLATRITFDRRVPPLGTLTVTVTPGSPLPAGAKLVASLYYRNLRTTYYQAATASTTATAPKTLIAQVPVP
jgi:hypothetical protein